MAFVDVGIGTMMLIGGGLGATAGGIYAGSQGKNVLNGALMGGVLGAGAGAGLSALGVGAAAGGAADTAAIAAGGAGGGGAFVPASGIATDAFTGSAVANTAAANAAAANAAAAGAPMGADMAGGYSAGANAVNPLDAYTGTANAIPPSTPSVPGVPNAANPAASGYGQYLKWGVPAAMVAYGSGLFGNKTSGPGITSQNTIGQSKPVPGIMSAQLSPNYQGYFQAKKGGIAKLAVGGGAEAQMTPDVNQTSVNPADLNQSKSASLSPQTQSLLNQYGINQSQATGVLSALQSQGIGNQPTHAASGGIMGLASGGGTSYHLGGYSDGGRLLKGPGDGMSDEIPATIGHKQPARLADGEFVVPADVVSHLGNGSTDAGAKHLYKMMDKVRTARVGHKKQGKQIKADKYLPK